MVGSVQVWMPCSHFAHLFSGRLKRASDHRMIRNEVWMNLNFGQMLSTKPQEEISTVSFYVKKTLSVTGQRSKNTPTLGDSSPNDVNSSK